MDNIDKILPITKVKKELLDVVKEIDDEDSTITVTKNGVPVSVMMTPKRYEGLLETIEILSNPKIMKALAASEKDFRSGKVYSHKDVWSD
ncbi:MAG: type II toxin-antitoxin system Phd/YefM family antitoxin [bacterium]|nr:MAG: type II toxin-antitoxin system Phd/YefM family antitoxin [bacterium]